MAALPLDGASPTCTPLDNIDTRVRCCADASTEQAPAPTPTPAPTPDPFPNHPPTRSVSEFTCAELNFDELSGTDQVCAASTWSSSVSGNPTCRRGSFEWARRVCEDRAGGRGAFPNSPCAELNFDELSGTDQVCAASTWSSSVSGNPTCRRGSFEWARRVCEDRAGGRGGARLCTLAELVAGEGDASTCRANDIAIWTRTPCNVDGGGQGFMAALPLDGASPTCTPLDDVDTRVRCCADANN
eukprot:jgi/Tetstr1/438328/TSEL_026895.t1